MGKLIYAMTQSLDGYIDGVSGALEPPLHSPDPELFRHFDDHVRSLVGSLYGRRMYEVMRYWDEDRPEWGALERSFAVAWRAQRKWVVSRSQRAVGAKARLVVGDLEAFALGLKAEVHGDIAVAGAELAGCLTDLGLIDEYRLYLRPFVLGGGKPYFVRARPPLRLVSVESVGSDATRLVYVPA